MAAVCRLIDVHRGRLRGGPINLIMCLGGSQHISLGGASIEIPTYTVHAGMKAGKGTPKSATRIIRGIHFSGGGTENRLKGKKKMAGVEGVGSKHMKTGREVYN